MSEQKQSFMHELDFWIHANVTAPLFEAAQHYEDAEGVAWERAVAQVNHAISSKVLESYKNGLRAGAGYVRKELPDRAAP